MWAGLHSFTLDEQRFAFLAEEGILDIGEESNRAVIVCTSVMPMTQASRPLLKKLVEIYLSLFDVGTVYLLWLTWPHKWQCHLTYTEWNIQESLRTTSSLIVTTSVSLYLNTYHTCRALWCGVYGLHWDVLGAGPSCCGVVRAVSLGKALQPYIHSLDPGVNGYLVGQWLLVCLNSFQCCDGSSPGCTTLPRELG